MLYSSVQSGSSVILPRVSVILNILTRLLRLAPELDQIVEALAQVWLNSLAMYHSP